MLATSRAGYPTEVQLELVVVALAWGDVLMNTCWNGNRMQSARHTWYIDAATNIHMDQCILHELFDAMFSKVCSAMCSATWSAKPRFCGALSLHEWTPFSSDEYQQIVCGL